jgi:ATP-dependent Clp protease adapter protein ClpS
MVESFQHRISASPNRLLRMSSDLHGGHCAVRLCAFLEIEAIVVETKATKMLDVPVCADPCHVYLLDDDDTPLELVVDVFTTVFGKSPLDAKILAVRAHEHSEAMCGAWPRDVADALISAARRHMARTGHTLTFALRSAAGEGIGGDGRCAMCGRYDGENGHCFRRNGVALCPHCIQSAQGHLASSVGTARLRFSYEVLAWHFAGIVPGQLVTTRREYSERARADLQLALDQLFAANTIRCLGVRRGYRFDDLSYADLMATGSKAKEVVPVQYVEIDIGEDQPRRCIDDGLWLLKEGELRYAALVSRLEIPQGLAKIRVEMTVPGGAAGNALVERLFAAIEAAIQAGRSYRGKILSLEATERWGGLCGQIVVHRLPAVARDQVILPSAVLALLDRNVIEFAQQREKLRTFGQSSKKGLLFYGPPGTGKTHTLRYLASSLPGHTTLLVTAEQVGLLAEYFSLARLLQPSLLVIEDADLIARQREEMGSACEETLLNKLLNEMDGLREDADIFFILTTNRPEQLESALAGRPGRVDQAIEFPLPDTTAREKLVNLYGAGLNLPPEIVMDAVRRTERVSASFIKELMRRTAQASLAGGERRPVSRDDLDQALADMLFTGGRLNTMLLGGPPAHQDSYAPDRRRGCC